jgi:hypothetical protein
MATTILPGSVSVVSVLPTPDPDTQKQLYHQADMAFWAQTGYQPGKALDPHNPHDQAMLPVWQAVYQAVLAKWRAGTLAMSHQEGATQAVAAAHDATERAAASVAAASHKPRGTPEEAAHLKDAGAAHREAADATKSLMNWITPMIPNSIIDQAISNLAADPPPVVDYGDVVKAMQGASAPAHADAVSSAAPIVHDQGGAPLATEVHHYNLATKWTPLIALGGVAAALGLGAMIQGTAHSARRSYRRRRARR